MALEVNSNSALALGEALASLPTLAITGSVEAHPPRDEEDEERAMARAVESGDVALVVKMLSREALTQDALQRHLLAACGKGHRKIVKRFYEHGVMPELEACVANAMAGGHENVINYLLSLPHVSFKVNKRNAPTPSMVKIRESIGEPHLQGGGEGTLLLAVEKGATSIFKYLFPRYKWDVEEWQREHMALKAVQTGNLAIFAHLVEEGGVSVSRDSCFHKLRYIAQACTYGRVEILDYLHAQGLPVAEDMDCFRLAVECGNMDVVERLTQLGAKFHAKNPRDSFITACRLGRLEGVKYMIARELIDVREVGRRGFHEANECGHFHVSEHLLLSAAQFTPDSLGWGLIQVTGRNFKLFKHLHRRGAPLKERYPEILYEARKRCDIETLKYCAAHGARPAHHELVAALSVAAKFGYIELFEYFRDRYDRLSTDTRVELLEHAASYGCIKVAAFIIDTSDIDRELHGNRITLAATRDYDGRFRAFLRERGFHLKYRGPQSVCDPVKVDAHGAAVTDSG